VPDPEVEGCLPIRTIEFNPYKIQKLDKEETSPTAPTLGNISRKAEVNVVGQQQTAAPQEL